MITIELNSGVKLRYYGAIDIKFGESCGVEALSIEAHSTGYIPISDIELDIWRSDVYDFIYLKDIKSIVGTDELRGGTIL